MVVRVVHKNVRISPRKAVLMCRLIHRKKVSEAYRILHSVREKKMVQILFKLLYEAVSNAVNNYALISDNLYIESCVSNKGSSLKRLLIRARGRSDIQIHRFTNLCISLTELQDSKKGKKEDIKEKGFELSTKKIEEKIRERE